MLETPFPFPLAGFCTEPVGSLQRRGLVARTKLAFGHSHPLRYK